MIVVLTRTGEQFWYQSEKYSPRIFHELQNHLLKQEDMDQGSVTLDNLPLIAIPETTKLNKLLDDNYDDDFERPRILRIHRKIY